MSKTQAGTGGLTAFTPHSDANIPLTLTASQLAAAHARVGANPHAYIDHGTGKGVGEGEVYVLLPTKSSAATPQENNNLGIDAQPTIA